MLIRAGWAVAAATIGLALTLTIVAAQATDFDSSYKTGPAEANQDDVITYTIVALNAGEAKAGVVLTDPVPRGAAYVPASCVYRRQTGGTQPCGPPPDLWEEDFAADDCITTTFAVRVTEGSMGWPLVNCAYLRWDGNRREMCITTILNPHAFVYLPVILRNFSTLPDLWIASLTVEPAGPSMGQTVAITIVVQNAGAGAAGPFWVDFYDNPDPPPTRANQPFDSLCPSPEDCYGIAWYVEDGLEAGQSVTLSSLQGYLPEYSRWPGYFVSSGVHEVYAFADTWNDAVWYGAVLEQNEGLDNRYGPVFVNVVPGAGGWSVEWDAQDFVTPRRPDRP